MGKTDDFESNALEFQDDVRVFSTQDEKLRFLGRILGNESSRKILMLLLEKEMTITEISQKSAISSNLVIYHLKKMVESGLVYVAKEKTNSRGHALRYYRAKQSLIILGGNTKVENRKTLQKALKDFIRLGAIAMAGTITWMATSSSNHLDSAFKYPRPTLPPYMTPMETSVIEAQILAALITAGVVSSGLATWYFVRKRL